LLPTQNLYEITVSKYFVDYERKIKCDINNHYISDSELLNDEKVIYTNGIFFSDRFFNQNSKDFEFFFSAWSPNSNEPYYYIVEVQNISENYYGYIKDTNIYHPENEYYNVFNNIVGGRGIFALSATKTIEITP